MSDEDVPNAALFIERQGTSQRPGIDGDRVVDEEVRGPVTGSRSSITSENLQSHRQIYLDSCCTQRSPKGPIEPRALCATRTDHEAMRNHTNESGLNRGEER